MGKIALAKTAVLALKMLALVAKNNHLMAK
jgi:hypothetical protein